jgi:acetylxylan esterase
MARFFFSAATTLLASVAAVYGAALTKVNSFGNNPTGAEMYIYVPDTLVANPPILVAIHYCTGTAQAYYSGTQFKSYADQYGYIVIYPDAPDRYAHTSRYNSNSSWLTPISSGGCWDVHSAATLSHDAGGDSLAIANMVRHTISTYQADASRVFAVGTQLPSTYLPTLTLHSTPEKEADDGSQQALLPAP